MADKWLKFLKFQTVLPEPLHNHQHFGLESGYVQTSDKRRAKSEDWRVNGGEEEVAHVAPREKR